MLRDLGGWHLLIILAIVILLFGSTKLPGLAKGIGQSMRIFRNEIKNDPEPAPVATPESVVPQHTSSATTSDASAAAGRTESPGSAAA